jgi:hypothetical protein
LNSLALSFVDIIFIIIIILIIPNIDGSLEAEMPQCNYLCDKDPLDNPTLYNRTWLTGSFAIGTKALYTCAGIFQFFKLNKIKDKHILVFLSSANECFSK